MDPVSSSGRLVRAVLSISLCFVFGLVVAGAALAETVKFQSTGEEQTFRVPAGVTSIHVVATGGKGGSGASGTKSPGFGTTATGDLLVSPQQLLYIEVGGNGGSATTAAGGAGGFNGGGTGGTTGAPAILRGGGGGGGASDIRLVPRSAGGSSLESRLITAGGGGGAGGGPEGGFGGSGSSEGFGQGGQGGGGLGGGSGATGATTSGPGGEGVLKASLGNGGNGGSSAAGTAGGGGGGGGGGIFGGGGGINGSGDSSGGGAGAGSSAFGSSVKNTSLAIDNTGVPAITITYTLPANNGGGGKPGNGGNGNTGKGAALDTTIDAHPPKLIETRKESRRVRFRFSANQNASGFLCRLDFNPFAPCLSPKRYRVGLGVHTFKVKAVGDRSPAVFTFRLKRKS